MNKAAWFFWALMGFIWLFASLPFSDYSLASLFDIPHAPQGLQDLARDCRSSSKTSSSLPTLVSSRLSALWHEKEVVPARRVSPLVA